MTRTFSAAMTANQPAEDDSNLSHLQAFSAGNYRYAALAELQLPMLQRLLGLTALLAWLSMLPQSGDLTSLRYGMALALLLWSGVSLWMSFAGYTLGALGLLVGWSIYLLTLGGWQGEPYYLAGLPLVMLMAVLLMGRRRGLVVAIALTLLLWAMQSGLDTISPTLFMIVVGQIWLLMGLFLVGMLPLYQIIDWSWSAFLLNQQRQQELRKNRGQLAQALSQLDQAYRQLESLNEKLAYSKRVAEEEQQKKAEFAANMSHELRTPINMVIGFTELILNSPRSYGPTGLPQALMGDLEVVHRNGRHLAQLIDDVLDMSQASAQRMVLSRKWQNFAQPVGEALDQIRPLFLAKGLTLVVNMESELPVVAIDAVRIRQVVLNLLSNSARFTDQGGVTVSVHSANGALYTCVADTGAGIPAEDLERIFEPFYQVDASLRRKVGGSGLGLAISREIVRLHGGRMWATSQLGVGTEFYFTLPVSEDEQVSTAHIRHPLPETQRNQRARRVVLDRAATTLERHFRRSDRWSAVTIVETPDAALAAAAFELTDLVVLGAATAAEGAALLTEAAANAEDTPVMVCHLPNLALQYPAVHLFDHLIKPIMQPTFTDLLARVARLYANGTTNAALSGHPLGPSLDIMIVDDDPDMVRLLTRWVSAAGGEYQALAAYGGAEALALLAQRVPDVLLLDLAMLEVDGFAVLAHLNATRTLQSVPVVLMSTYDPQGEHALLPQGIFGITTGSGLTPEQVVACASSVVAALHDGLGANANAP
jgi:signal transduction histidine kinase/CheY-like chemotaxis protein